MTKIIFCNERPIFGLKCPFRSVQYPDGRVLGSLCGKMAQNMFLEGHKYLRIYFWGVGCLPSPLEHLHFAQYMLFWAKLRGPWREGRHPDPPQKNSLLLMTLLEHVFGAFFHINPLEPFHLGIAHFYRGISSQKSGCARGCAGSLQNTILLFFIFLGHI